MDEHQLDAEPRCSWAGETPMMSAYHDSEWGFPVADDHRLFEKVCLEGFQSGLSWRTILTKRPAFREAFADFDPAVVAAYGDKEVEQLLGNAGIVRHRGKITATINNAQRALEMMEEAGSLAAYFWRFEAANPLPEPAWVTTSDEAIALSKDLKKRGWRFVGPTTIYAFMQAMGLVNDHELGCVIREAIVAARRGFTSPAG